MAERLVLGERTHRYGAPPEVIHRAVAGDRARWVVPRPGEVLPDLLHDELTRVVWSSPWPASPGDTIELLLAGGSHTDLTFRWTSDSPPDERGTGITRQRLNERFGDELRGWLTTDEAWRDATSWL